MYFLDFYPEAAADWKATDKSITAIFLKILKRRLIVPHIPGARLSGNLRGCYKISLNKSGYRLIYLVQDEELRVFIISVGKREDKVAYRLAAQRLQEIRD